MARHQRDAGRPYDRLPSAPPLTVRSDDVADGSQMPMAQVHEGAGGDNRSPHLTWSGAPDETRGYAVTCFDPDAPRPQGWWHWVVVGLPPGVTSLSAAAGAVGSQRLPRGALQLRNDFGNRCYDGAAPPRGHGPHRYIFAVSALDTDQLGIHETTPAPVAQELIEDHTLARGLLTVTWER